MTLHRETPMNTAQRERQHETERYWVVMNTDVRDMHCTYRHASLGAALAECERLARTQGGSFGVFELVSEMKPKVEHIWASIVEPLPF